MKTKAEWERSKTAIWKLVRKRRMCGLPCNLLVGWLGGIRKPVKCSWIKNVKKIIYRFSEEYKDKMKILDCF